MIRPSFTPAQRLATFEAHGAIVCCQAAACDSAIYIKGCHIDHHLALIDGGKHELENWRPICLSCHRRKSALEHKRNAKTKRIAARRAVGASVAIPHAKPWPSRKLRSRPFPRKTKAAKA